MSGGGEEKFETGFAAGAAWGSMRRIIFWR